MINIACPSLVGGMLSGVSGLIFFQFYKFLLFSPVISCLNYGGKAPPPVEPRKLQLKLRPTQCTIAFHHLTATLMPANRTGKSNYTDIGLGCPMSKRGQQ